MILLPKLMLTAQSCDSIKVNQKLEPLKNINFSYDKLVFTPRDYPGNFPN